MADLLLSLLLTGPKLKPAPKPKLPYCYKHNREKVQHAGVGANCPECRKEQYKAKRQKQE